MVDLLTQRQIYQYLVNILKDNNENATVRAKAQEIIALFDPPSLAEMQTLFETGTVAQKLAALGSLQSAIVRGGLRS